VRMINMDVICGLPHPLTEFFDFWIHILLVRFIALCSLRSLWLK